MSYRAYTYLTDLILVSRNLYYNSDTEVPVSTTEYFTGTRVPVGTTEQIPYTEVLVGTTGLILNLTDTRVLIGTIELNQIQEYP